MGDLPASLQRARAAAFRSPAVTLAEQAPGPAPLAARDRWQDVQVRSTPRVRQGDYARERQYRVEGARDQFMHGRTLGDRVGAAGTLAANALPVVAAFPMARNAVRAGQAGDYVSAGFEGGQAALEVALAGLPGRGEPLFGAMSQAPARFRAGPSLASMVDGHTMPGSGNLIVGALRRQRAPMDNEAWFERPMPIRSLEPRRVRPTDGVPPDDYHVQQYMNAPDHNPIVVQRPHGLRGMFRRRGDFDVIDGHHRLEAARRRGVPVEALDASEYFGRRPLFEPSPAAPAARAGEAAAPRPNVPRTGQRFAPRAELDWLRSPDGRQELIRNPTPEDLLFLTRENLGNELKFVRDTDGNIYAFSSKDAHHNNAMRALREHGVEVMSLGEGAEITNRDAAGFIYREPDGRFVHADDGGDTGPWEDFVARVQPRPIPLAIRPQTRASDGSILPRAEPRPFSNTAGTSADLREAARSGGPMRLYRGSTSGDPQIRPNSYWSKDPAYASRQAMGQGVSEGQSVIPADATFRNPYHVRDARESGMVEVPETGGGAAWIESLRARGHDAIIDDIGNQVYVLDANSVQPAIRQQAPTPRPQHDPMQGGTPSRIPSKMRVEVQQPPGQLGSRYRLELDSQKNGFITVTDGGDVWRVNNSHLDPDLRNQGHGVRLYEDLVLRAREAGARTLRSDNSVSTDAQNAWMGLQRRGYPVARIETPDGPRFEVDLTRPQHDPMQGGTPEARGLDSDSSDLLASIGAPLAGAALFNRKRRK